MDDTCYYHAWKCSPIELEMWRTTLRTQTATDTVDERQPAELKWKPTDWDSVLGRMLALLFSYSCFPMPSSTATAVQRESARVKGNFSIAGAVRQKTGERENKSAPSLVSADHPWQGNSAGRQGRSWGVAVGGVREDSDYRGIMSFYCMSLRTWPHGAVLL